MRTIPKVMAYITCKRGGREQLLVFRHRDYPEAGIQVPAGSIEEGESIEAALWREVEEESGLTGLELVRKIGTFDYVHPYTGNLHVRHVFHLRAPEDTPDEWEWIETSGGAVPDDEGFVFQFYWVDLDGELHLIGGRGDYLRYMYDE